MRRFQSLIFAILYIAESGISSRHGVLQRWPFSVRIKGLDLEPRHGHRVLQRWPFSVRIKGLDLETTVTPCPKSSVST